MSFLNMHAPPREDGSALFPRHAVASPNMVPPVLHVVTRFTHAPVIDSLVPAPSNASVTPSGHQQSTSAILLIGLPLVALLAIVAITFFVVRYTTRQAAIKRRRQASWILRSAQWNTESKRTDAHETQTSYSHASSTFSAYPYPLSEHYR